MKFKTLIPLLLLLLMPVVQASELTQYLADLKTFKARFMQTIYSSNNEKKQVSYGVILVKSPDRFYLSYNKPFQLLYVADGKKLWSFDQDLEQVVVKPQGDILINTPAMLLGNPKDLTASYKIEKPVKQGNWLWFELIPKDENGSFISVSLAFEQHKLKAMEMKDNFGQVTRLEFDSIVKNSNIPDRQFYFTPPKGVDVLGQ